jgi:hypothetical protein
MKSASHIKKYNPCLFSWGEKMSQRLRVDSWIQFISMILTIWLVFQPGKMLLLAQQTAPPQLRIVVLEGEGAINNIKTRTAREPLVLVEDENHKPVAGALVLFTLPDSGPGAAFANGSKTSMSYTDKKGQAKGRGLKANSVEGQFQIVITATYRGAETSITIGQTNAMTAAAVAAAGISAKLLILLVVAGAAAAAGTAAALSGNNGSNTNNGPAPIIITPGTPTMGNP